MGIFHIVLVAASIFQGAIASLPVDPWYTESVLAIKDTINHYPLAIDTKNFSALAGVFTKDAIANYSAPLGVLHGLAAIEGNISYALSPVTTQHSLTTQIVDVLNKNTASAMTYFFANHFGKGNFTGQYLTAFGRYEDRLVLVREGWRIDRRQVLFMGSNIGNISIFGVPS